MALAGATRRCFALLGAFPARRGEDLRGALGVGRDGRDGECRLDPHKPHLVVCAVVKVPMQRCQHLASVLCCALTLVVEGVVIKVSAGGTVSEPTYLFSDIAGSSLANLTGSGTQIIASVDLVILALLTSLSATFFSPAAGIR
eukprot:7381537-Prymnesium_polylepis.1